MNISTVKNTSGDTIPNRLRINGIDFRVPRDLYETVMDLSSVVDKDARRKLKRQLLNQLVKYSRDILSISSVRKESPGGKMYSKRITLAGLIGDATLKHVEKKEGFSIGPRRAEPVFNTYPITPISLNEKNVAPKLPTPLGFQVIEEGEDAALVVYFVSPSSKKVEAYLTRDPKIIRGFLQRVGPITYYTPESIAEPSRDIVTPNKLDNAFRYIESEAKRTSSVDHLNNQRLLENLGGELPEYIPDRLLELEEIMESAGQKQPLMR